jgi:hypothetical protein
MNIDPNYAICAYRDYPKQIIEYIKDSIGISICIDDGTRSGNSHMSIFVLDNNNNPILELYYCNYGAYRDFYMWTDGAPRLLEYQYNVNFVPVSNIINRIKQTYIDYRRQQKADHQQDIKDAGLVYEV